MTAKSPSTFRTNATASIGKTRPVPKCPNGPDVPDDYLTHWTPEQFRDEPWYEHQTYKDEFDLSMVVGHLTLKQAVYALWRRPLKPTDAARCFKVDRLREHQYRCISTPSRRNPRHASVMAPLIDKPLSAHIAWWRSPDRVRLYMLAEEVPNESSQEDCSCNCCSATSLD